MATTPGVRSCYNDLARLPSQAHPGDADHYIEEQGPIQAWCGAVRLFATAAKAAGPNLNRRTFVEAMSKITDYPGTLAPVWSFGPTKFYGPTQYQVVEVHNNVPQSKLCKMPKSGIAAGDLLGDHAAFQAAAPRADPAADRPGHWGRGLGQPNGPGLGWRPSRMSRCRRAIAGFSSGWVRM